MKLALSGIDNSLDGMATHHATIMRILNQIGDVTLIPDRYAMKTSEMNQYDFIFRYGWSKISRGYDDANFDYNISSNRQKNILIAPFCVPMLHQQAASQIQDRFGRIIYDSSLSKEHGRSIMPYVRSTIVHPTLDEMYRIPSLLESSPDAFKPYMYLHVSNGLYWIKGVDLIIDSFIKTFSSNDNVVLYLVLKNQDDMFKEIKKRFKDEERAHQLYLYENRLPKSRLAKLYEQADCYVCTSRYDTFSLPTLEAAVYGLQIIAHEECGVRDYVHDFDINQYVPLATSSIIVPKDIWRGNRPVSSWEPVVQSIREALRLTYMKGHRPKHINKRLLCRFGREDEGLSAVKEILA